MYLGFASDNTAGAHPKIMEALSCANEGFLPPYGEDRYGLESDDSFRKIFGEDMDVCLTLSGTGANVLSLRAMLRPWQGIICTDIAHIHTDESGAPEHCTGSKILPVVSRDGKMFPKDMNLYLPDSGNLHRSSPAVLSITQSTEAGTLYTVEEIRALCDYAHSHGLYVHMDGSRIANAVVALDVDIKAMTRDAGVDVLSFGGTKNGLLIGDAVVFFNQKFSKDYKTMRKQSLQLISKMRYISAQFIEYFKNDLWLENARHANAMAQYFAKQLSLVPTIRVRKPEANAVFVRMDPALMKKLMQEYYFYETNPHIHEARLMCSFATQEKDIDAFVKRVLELA